MTANGLLPIKDTLTPDDQAAAADAVRAAYESDTVIYPIGGGTSLGFGLPAKKPGHGLSLAGLKTVVDYPARDMTVTVEAGLTMGELNKLLATERQMLPLDVPQAESATIGGVIATNTSGPRRYGLGTVRDYVIGIHAIDGRGMPFKGGGRVVKNVAGYDFCKLLTGSLGTLGVITQVTLKLKPLPEQSALMACVVGDLTQAEQILAAFVSSQTTPVAVELLCGPAWDGEPTLKTLAAEPLPQRYYVVAALEGTAIEVSWMTSQLHREWRELGIAAPITIGNAADLWSKLVEFPAAGDSPLVLKASLTPGGVTAFIEAIQKVDPAASIQSHAASGIVIARFSKFPDGGLSRALVGNLQNVAAAHHGHVVIYSNPSSAEMTRQSVWGATDAPVPLMSAVKQQFDPKNIV
ncbi:MAG TPA: FAD-binding oxidoreductase, partial [Pirellulaceae bacterium]|nr:FAD-binding oxidoreductase [Pirellulaceae bacterium]